MSSVSSDDERMGLQIKPPSLVPRESSKSSRNKFDNSRERRRALASRLGPRESGGYSSGGHERSSSSRGLVRGGSDHRERDRARHREEGESYGLISQSYGDQPRDRSRQSGANWDRGRQQAPKSFGRDQYERGNEDRLSRKRPVRERLGPVEQDPRTARYWEEKGAAEPSSSEPRRENRSKDLQKHKERRKHLEEEEARAFREIEKRRQKERRQEERRGSSRSGEKRSRSKHAVDADEASPAKDTDDVEEVDDRGLIEVEEIVVSPSSTEDVEELEDGAVPSNSDLSANSEGEPERSDRREREQRSRDVSAQNSEISSDEEAEDVDEGNRRSGSPGPGQSSSSKSSSDSESDSSSKSSDEDDQKGHRSGSPNPKRSRRTKHKHSAKQQGSSPRRRGEEKPNGSGSNSKPPSARSGSEHSDEGGNENYTDEDEGKSLDVEMIEVKEGEVKVVPPPEVLEVKVEVELTEVEKKKLELDLLPPYFPAIQGCRRVEEFTLLNRIEEGTYGVVYRAKDKRTNEIVALKRLKMEKEKDGFPITSLREINTLLKAQHENIVTVREIVVGSNTDKIFLVMDYIEHDLKALMETLRGKGQKFILSEVKCLMMQLLKAVAHLHDNWILHRDLKASNILMSHKGILKVGDFGLAREYGSPLKPYTPIVVTLWYRAPELLLQAKEYSTPIDMWSVGCIFGELLKMEPMFPGKSEANQLNLIFSTLGTPNDKIWPGYSKLPLLQKMTFTENPVNKLKTKFSLSELGIDLLNKMLTYNPAKRITAEDAIQHAFFKERPLPIEPSLFSTWPAKSELGHRKAAASPKPPSGGRQFKDLREEEGEGAGFFLGIGDRRPPIGAGFNLKF